MSSFFCSNPALNSSSQKQWGATCPRPIRSDSPNPSPRALIFNSRIRRSLCPRGNSGLCPYALVFSFIRKEPNGQDHRVHMVQLFQIDCSTGFWFGETIFELTRTHVVVFIVTIIYYALACVALWWIPWKVRPLAGHSRCESREELRR